jgi:hypothetical protein
MTMSYQELEKDPIEILLEYKLEMEQNFKEPTQHQ